MHCCFSCFMSYFFGCRNRRSPLIALRALVPYVPCALNALVPYVPRVSPALCPTCSRASRASYPTCSRVLGATCPTCSCALRALVPYVPHALHALMPHVRRVLRAFCLTCLVPKRALVSHVSYVLLYLACLVPFAFSGCLELYVLFCSSSLTWFRCFKPNMLLCISCLAAFMPCVSCAFVALAI